MFILFKLSFLDILSPKTKAPSLPKEQFERFNLRIANASKNGFKFSKFLFFKLFPLTFKVQIFLYNVINILNHMYRLPEIDWIIKT